MDIFSIASNLQQIAIGGVNYVNNKLRKKNTSSECNYITYIVIGENEKQPYDINMFFLPFKICTKMKLKEFKEYFPFKDNVIFRFKIHLSDLIDVINEGIINNTPLMKEDTNKRNEIKHIISDENEIKNILRQDNLNHLWVDITNEDSYVPFYNGQIIVKVLFMNTENYKEYDNIYFKNINPSEYCRPIYNLNVKNLCSYTEIIEEEKVKSNNIDNAEVGRDENFEENIKSLSPHEDRENLGHSDQRKNTQNVVGNGSGNSNIGNTDEFAGRSGNYHNNPYCVNGLPIERTYKKGHIPERANQQPNQYEKNINNECKEYNFFQNENIKNGKDKQKSCEHILEKNSYYNTSTKLLLTSRNNALGQYEDTSKGNTNQDKDGNLDKGGTSDVNEKSDNNKNSDNKNKYKQERQDAIKMNVSNRLQELKEYRNKEEEKFKEKVVIREQIKKQIDKWSKISDDTYKDIKVMLSTLNDVLWENSEWKQVPMSDLISNSVTVKKAYKNAILLCHPDKHRNKPVERVLRAEMIFQALNNAYKEKKIM
ncbi:hypothetical protein, conserved [Plasmodium gonderi]|uniref:DIX domain-containing protein n=1 Tax=Plasmodium gonderi TaxID=77519 RepID=A0A1Y1JRK6_PLAGO|nr:hypothetical protein, conserved [Plasmodium gonderi]GAW83103.1 hypothetical protein, conserved [Plasmodium gonderi]